MMKSIRWQRRGRQNVVEVPAPLWSSRLCAWRFSVKLIAAPDETGDAPETHRCRARKRQQWFDAPRRELVRSEASIRPLMAQAGTPLRFFRFPFNHTGDFVEKREALATVLRKPGYEMARCTIDNEDFELTLTYS